MSLINEKELRVLANSPKVLAIINNVLTTKIKEASERISSYTLSKTFEKMIDTELNKQLKPLVTKYVKENEEELVKLIIKKRLK